jgi:hypothetical protein
MHCCQLVCSQGIAHRVFIFLVVDVEVTGVFNESLSRCGFGFGFVRTDSVLQFQFQFVKT